MSSTIENLYFGNVNLNAAQSITSDSYRKALNTVVRTQDLLLDLLAGEEKALLLEMVDAISAMGGDENVSHFEEGFRLGARLMLEVMTG